MGPKNSGKTSLINQILHNEYQKGPTTIGLEIMGTKTLNNKLTILLMDTNNEERWKFILKILSPIMQAGIICTDNYYEQRTEIIEQIRIIRKNNKEKPVFLVETKTDKKKYSELEALIKNYDLIGPIYTSSKTGTGIKELIRTIEQSL